MVKVQLVPLTMWLVPTVKVRVAVEDEESDPVTVNVAEPHPDLVTDGAFANPKVGSTTEITSSIDNTTFTENKIEIDDDAAVTGLAMDNLEISTVGTGCESAGDVVISVSVISLALAIVTTTVRVAKLLG